MKTYTAKGGTRFTFHPDFSGNIVIAHSANGSALEVKAKDLDEFFVTQWLRPRLEGSIDDTIRALSDAIKTHTEPPPVPPKPQEKGKDDGDQDPVGNLAELLAMFIMNARWPMDDVGTRLMAALVNHIGVLTQRVEALEGGPDGTVP